MELDSWGGSAHLDTPAVKLLRKLVEALPADQPLRIAVFESASIQVRVDETLTSADVDLFSDAEELADVVERAGLDREHSASYIRVCSELNFRTSPRWRERMTSAQIGHCTFYFPHSIDILIAKLHRLEEKDLLAFRVVIAKTGHPTEVELIRELQLAVDLFRPSFDEEQGRDLATNCIRLWPLLFGREIDPRTEIIAPALAERRRGYGEPTRDYKQELRDAARGL